MSIDWFTVAAQILNFLVLMWLLKRFLYKPILNAIHAREKHISDQLYRATEKENAAQKEQEVFQEKIDSLDNDKAQLMMAAKVSAAEVRAKLLKTAQDEADAIRLKRLEALQNELDDLSEDIVRQTKEQVFAVAAKVLSDLADSSLEERMFSVFVKRLQSLNKKDRSALSSNTAIINSAFNLSQDQQNILKNELEIKTLRFKVVPELLSGIELSVNGHKLAWSISDYLETMKQEASHAS